MEADVSATPVPVVPAAIGTESTAAHGLPPSLYEHMLIYQAMQIQQQQYHEQMRLQHAQQAQAQQPIAQALSMSSTMAVPDEQQLHLQQQQLHQHMQQQGLAGLMPYYVPHFAGAPAAVQQQDAAAVPMMYTMAMPSYYQPGGRQGALESGVSDVQPPVYAQSPYFAMPSTYTTPTSKVAAAVAAAQSSSDLYFYVMPGYRQPPPPPFTATIRGGLPSEMQCAGASSSPGNERSGRPVSGVSSSSNDNVSKTKIKTKDSNNNNSDGNHNSISNDTETNVRVSAGRPGCPGGSSVHPPLGAAGRGAAATEVTSPSLPSAITNLAKASGREHAQSSLMPSSSHDSNLTSVANVQSERHLQPPQRVSHPALLQSHYQHQQAYMPRSGPKPKSKRPKTSYQLYCKEERDRIIGENTNQPLSEINRMLG
jgi:hypothetical protein